MHQHMQPGHYRKLGIFEHQHFEIPMYGCVHEQLFTIAMACNCLLAMQDFSCNCDQIN